jgi:heme oxygenase
MKLTGPLLHRAEHSKRELLGSGCQGGLADSLRERTSALHRKAEQSGIVGAMLAGRATRGGYALFLRNLLPAYAALESGLAQRRPTATSLSALFRRELVRVPALTADLVHLAGPDWAERLALLPEGTAYAQRVAAAAEGEGARLIAHAYARYLGDLNGGQALKRLLGGLVDFDANCLSFYEFPEVVEVRAFARLYRAAIDAAAEHCSDLEGVTDEAVVAFELNIALSEAVLALEPATTR